MANLLCECNNGLSNTGLPLCERIQKVIKKFIFVQLYSNAGVKNKIDPSATLNLAWITALINNTNKSLRYFPTPEIKNVDTPKDAPVMEKYNDDSSNFVRESTRKFTGLIPVCPPMYKGKLESVRCNNNTGIFMIDIEGNVIGLTNNADNYLYPIPVNAQSLVASVIFGNDSATTGIKLDFEFPAALQDANFRMITGSKFTDFNPATDISGLLDTTTDVVANSTTKITVTITTPSPALDEPIAVEGLVASDFVSTVGGATSKVRNTTDAADVAITGCTEISAGVYELTFVAQGSAENIRVLAKLNGYEFSYGEDAIP